MTVPSLDQSTIVPSAGGETPAATLPATVTLPRRQATSGQKTSVSFEFFPPGTDAMAEQLWDSAQILCPLQPAFVSVTYGAGGSTRERTHNTVVRLQNSLGLKAAAHLTCVDASRSEIGDVAASYWQAGIRHIVALRGDPPGQMGGHYVPCPDGYRDAADLVQGLRDIAPFEISVAAYPEKHPEAPSLDADIDNLKRKLDAGASRAITQFFFDNRVYFRFRDAVARAGIRATIVPGILPISNYARTCRIAKACQASIPGWMHDQFGRLDDDPETRRAVAIAIAEEQCRELITEGVESLHFYTLNRADLVYGICHMLGVRAATV